MYRENQVHSLCPYEGQESLMDKPKNTYLYVFIWVQEHVCWVRDSQSRFSDNFFFTLYTCVGRRSHTSVPRCLADPLKNFNLHVSFVESLVNLKSDDYNCLVILPQICHKEVHLTTFPDAIKLLIVLIRNLLNWFNLTNCI